MSGAFDRVHPAFRTQTAHTCCLVASVPRAVCRTRRASVAGVCSVIGPVGFVRRDKGAIGTQYRVECWSIAPRRAVLACTAGHVLASGHGPCCVHAVDSRAECQRFRTQEPSVFIPHHPSFPVPAASLFPTVHRFSALRFTRLHSHRPAAAPNCSVVTSAPCAAPAFRSLSHLASARRTHPRPWVPTAPTRTIPHPHDAWSRTSCAPCPASSPFQSTPLPLG